MLRETEHEAKVKAEERETPTPEEEKGHRSSKTHR
jgi:hypothetical protein